MIFQAEGIELTNTRLAEPTSLKMNGQRPIAALLVRSQS
jgi:hypothetical protein